jgi:hypothetical protein
MSRPGSVRNDTDPNGPGRFSVFPTRLRALAGRHAPPGPAISNHNRLPTPRLTPALTPSRSPATPINPKNLFIT